MKLFKRCSTITIVLVYLVIIAGGVVRCTGSGMGCPDWPKCFGQWIPPTDISQLPANYIEKYSEGGKLTVEFNVIKTWTEYGNRLIGVLVGFSIFITMLFSLYFWKHKRSVSYCSILAFLLVGFQGWLGAKVVASNLKPFMITMHMLLALIIVAILFYANALSNNSGKSTRFFKLSLIACSLTLIQILLGTQVRQLIDEIALQYHYANRELWIERLSGIFTIHRLLSYIIVLICAWTSYVLFKRGGKWYAIFILLLVLMEFLSGLILTYFSVPAYIQPVHLILSSLLFGILFYTGMLHRFSYNN